MQRNYWVVRLGRGNDYAEVCHQRDLIAIGWTELDQDLSKFANLEQKKFTEKVGGMLAKLDDDKSKKSLASAANQLYKFVSVMKPGDIVISPANSEGLKYFGVVRGDYIYSQSDADLPYRHRRAVEWKTAIDKSQFSEGLRNSSGSIMTVFSVSAHANEIERLLGNPVVQISGENVENTTQFALESQLEDFLVENWKSLPFGKDFEIYKEDDEMAGQQYPTDVGRIDLLAKEKNGKTWLVIELKKGRSSDAVVGQLLRYKGYVAKHLATSGEKVRGMIITGEDDQNIRYAISGMADVEFMTYSVQFKLKPQKLD
jgi:restriction system protein